MIILQLLDVKYGRIVKWSLLSTEFMSLSSVHTETGVKILFGKVSGRLIKD